MDINYAIRNPEPPEITEMSTPDQVDFYKKWERSNRLCFMFIKTKVSAGIRGSTEQYDNVRLLIKAIDEQFVTSGKALASTLTMQFSSMKLTGNRGVRDHIMRMMDIAAQLKTLEVYMSETFLVHFVLCTLPQQYGPFNILITHISINGQLMNMCVQEEHRLAMEHGEKLNLTFFERKKKDRAKDKGKIPVKPDIKK